MGYTLYATKVNKNAYKGLIAAKYAGVDLELAPNFQLGVDNKTPEFLKMNPNGKVISSHRAFRECHFLGKISISTSIRSSILSILRHLS